MSSIHRTLAALIPFVALAMIGGCIRHQASHYTPPVDDGREMSAALEITPESSLEPAVPADRMVPFTPPATTQYVSTQPTIFPPTRIVVRVSDRGSIRRAWPLSVTGRPSGDVLAGPTYWPSVDRAVHRPNSTNVWLEPLEFGYNILLLPYRAIDAPPWSKIVYSPDGGVGWHNVEQSGIIFQERDE